MPESDILFGGSIPELYDRLLVPLIFESYARDLAERVSGMNPRELLETAAGTGVFTRAAASKLPRARIVATDLNEPMLTRAQARASHIRQIEWRQADALALPFENESFDVVACQFGVMFFPDKVRGYSEARRVLRPGGHFVFNVWDRISENWFADVVSQAMEGVFPNDPPRFLVRTPHAYHQPDRIREDLNASGFTDISINAVDATSRAASPRDAAIAFCQGTPLRNEIEARDPSGLEEATKQAANALASRFGSGAIEGGIRAFVITASR